MKYTLNLATREYVNRRRLYGVYAGLAIVLVMILGLNLTNLARTQKRFGEVRERLTVERGKGVASSATTAGGGVTAQQLAARIDFANELLKRDGYRWTALLDRLEAHLIPGIGGIESIQPDYKTGRLEITGTAASLPTLRRFIERLSTSPDIATVYLRQHALVDETSGAAEVGFTLELELKGVRE